MDCLALERRYDSPIPAADPAAPPPPPVALLVRLLREGRERLGRRRLTLPPGHPRLEMAAADIGAYRHGLVRVLPTGPAAGVLPPKLA
ncbi:hypothetical protein [Magnetospirillum moscoviense]|uniref:Uncharacterized protein n=1 Tax=Magnetospirillum moscoviense TaxID=1437059 RepID=A0A178MVA5_9PROT|nr:hypothetical protein [Magnetospirillum moscoviense]OAN54246.1 hypothetical protein A6A05_08735 [Magnetospirillum moscoviense]